MQKHKMLFPKNPADASTPWLWIGTWSMGGEGFGNHDERESMRVLIYAVENNIRHFDTAGFYAHGKSEKLLGKVMKLDRKAFFISTKGGLVWAGRNVRHWASPGALREQLYESLERLQTDYIDLYQLHWPDPEVPVNESLNALKQFESEGLIRYWGAGNLTARQVQEHIVNKKDIPHQVHFNPLRPSYGILSAGRDRCRNCVISPLEQGLLGTGRSASGSPGLSKRDMRTQNPSFSDPAVLKWNTMLGELAERYNIQKVTLILMWICAQENVHAIIPGPRRVNQISDILRFKNEVESSNLLSGFDATSVLSPIKVKEAVPDRLWEHLNMKHVKA
jgi:aryl-alcohol dehydrogenase-like predicted oxidoreductase